MTHFAVEFGDLESAVTRMRQQGATMADPGLTPGECTFLSITGTPDNRLVWPLRAVERFRR